MPIRQQLELLVDMDFFKLTTEEHQVLQEFNQYFEHYIQELVAKSLATATRLNPLFQVNTDAQNNITAKIRATILKKNFSDFFFELPQKLLEFCEKSPTSLIKLAFHPEGDFFYRYLQDILDKEIKQCLDPQENFESASELYQQLNTLDRRELLDQITLPANYHIFFAAIETVCFSLDWHISMLFCCDGTLLNRLAASFMYSHLIDKQLLIVDQPELAITPKTQAILECAINHGYYSAAHALIQRLTHTMMSYDSLTESDDYLEQVHRDYFLPLLIPGFKSVGYLLFVEMQQALYTKSEQPHHENLPADAVRFRQYQHLLQIYQYLHLARKDEHSCKNIIRLAFERDTVVVRLFQLFPVPNSHWREIKDVMQMFKDKFKCLNPDFAHIERFDHTEQPQDSQDVSHHPFRMGS